MSTLLKNEDNDFNFIDEVNDFKYSGFEFCRYRAYGRCRVIRRK